MKLKFAFFAEAAVVGDGLFSALRGGLDWVNARSFPAKMRHLVLLADVTFQPEELDKEHKCVCQVTAPNGNVLAPDLTVLMKPFPNTISWRHPFFQATAILKPASIRVSKPTSLCPRRWWWRLRWLGG